jgi:hypothetical protein
VASLQKFSLRAWLELGFSALISAALVIQFFYGICVSGLTSGYIVQFFTYFTILSNILVAVVLYTEGSTKLQDKSLPSRFEKARGTAVFCIITTGIIYSLFLRGPGGQGAVRDSIPWINTVFHYIMPAVMALDWVIFPTKQPARWISIIKWIVITVIYFIYVEILGFFTGTYPYFFLDPKTFHGYLDVLRGSLLFIPFFVVFGSLVIGANRISRKVRHL